MLLSLAVFRDESTSPWVHWRRTKKIKQKTKSSCRIFGQNVLMGCFHTHASFRSTESKAVLPESLTRGPVIRGKGSENWQAPKTPKSHYTQAYRGGIILSLSFKWLALAVTHSDVPQSDHNGLHYWTVQQRGHIREPWATSKPRNWNDTKKWHESVKLGGCAVITNTAVTRIIRQPCFFSSTTEHCLKHPWDQADRLT